MSRFWCAASLASLDLFVWFTTFEFDLSRCLWWRGSWGSQSYLVLLHRIPKWKSKKRSRMTYGKFCGQRVAPPKKKTHKITEEISCSLQHAEEIRRQNVRGMLQRWGFTACGKTWQNMFFFARVWNRRHWLVSKIFDKHGWHDPQGMPITNRSNGV